jgi:hypothetical protein
MFWKLGSPLAIILDFLEHLDDQVVLGYFSTVI